MICLRKVTLSRDQDWASSTLLWVRAKKKPSHYFPKAVTSQDDSNTAANKVQGFIRTLMLDALNKLMSTNIPIVKATDEDGHTFTSTVSLLSLPSQAPDVV